MIDRGCSGSLNLCIIGLLVIQCPKSPFHKRSKLLEGSWNELRELSYTFFYKHNDHKHIEAKIS